MTDEERKLSEARRRQIAEASRAANPRCPPRVIPPSDRGTDLLARLGVSVPDDDRVVNWAAIARQ